MRNGEPTSKVVVRVLVEPENETLGAATKVSEGAADDSEGAADDAEACAATLSLLPPVEGSGLTVTDDEQAGSRTSMPP